MNPLVDLHLQFRVIPALFKFNKLETGESLSSYENTFKMLLDKKAPKRTYEENRILYTEYITRLASEIATKVFDILNTNLVLSNDYCERFQKKFTSIYQGFMVKEGCELTKVEVDPILISVVKSRLTKQFQVHRAIECHVTTFLAPYKSGLISYGDEKALSRKNLAFGLEMQLGFQFNPVPCTHRHREVYAMHYYLHECAEYIIDQYQKELGATPSYEESLKDDRYKKIFNGCLEAVIEASDIDFPNSFMSRRKISERLHHFMQQSPRLNPTL